MQEQAKQNSAREMHKYVAWLVGLWLLFAFTSVIACIRVSQDKKFAAFHFHLKSWTLEGNLQQASGKSQVASEEKKLNKNSRSY